MTSSTYMNVPLHRGSGQLGNSGGEQAKAH